MLRGFAHEGSGAKDFYYMTSFLYGLNFLVIFKKHHTDLLRNLLNRVVEQDFISYLFSFFINQKQEKKYKDNTTHNLRQ